jgi:hypothetical protein
MTMMMEMMVMMVTTTTMMMSSLLLLRGLPLLALVDKGGVLGFDLSCNSLLVA